MTGQWQPQPSRLLAFLLLLPVLFIVTGFVIYPLANLFSAALRPGHIVENFQSFFDSRANRRAVWTTVRVSLIVTVLSMVFGLAMAWALLTVQSRVVRAVIWFSALIPFTMGVIVKNYVFTLLLSMNGPINQILLGSGLISSPVRLLYNETAVVIGMLYSMLPYAIIPIYVGLREIEVDLVRASRGLGASLPVALGTVVIPLAAPALASTASIVFVISVGFYVTPVLLGGAQSPFMAGLISDSIFRRFDFVEAAVASALMLMGSLAVFALTRWIVRKRAVEAALR